MHICQQGIYCTCTQFAGERDARDDLRVIADLPGLLDKVVRVDRDTVAPDKAGPVVVEVPLGPGSLEHFLGADPEPRKDHGELVHERDVEVALDVLDDLGHFRGFDVGCAVDGGDQPVEFRERIQRLCVHAGDDLGGVF